MDEPSRPRLTGSRRIGGEGEPAVHAADEQSAVEIDAHRWVRLATDVLLAEGVRGNAELSLLFVDDEEIASLNEQFLNKTGPTDVLAFPIDGDDLAPNGPPEPDRTGPDRSPVDPGEAPLLLGDVVVCPSVAAAQAPEHAGTLDDELALLVVHGVLHVLGYDHAEAVDRVRMQAREVELLSAHHWGGPPPAAFRQDHA